MAKLLHLNININYSPTAYLVDAVLLHFYCYIYCYLLHQQQSVRVPKIKVYFMFCVFYRESEACEQQDRERQEGMFL